MMKVSGGALRSSTIARLFAGTIMATALAGCETLSQGPATTGSIGQTATVNASDLTADQAVSAVQTWGARYGRDQKDKAAALNYAAALRAAGEPGQAVAVMRKAAIFHPEDREILAAFGKALAADGQFDEALATVHRAQRADNPDWQLLSTEGGILDSLGRHDEARALYRQALVLAPGEPQVLNNVGLSYVLTNELAEAEKVLRQAAASPKATLKIRENLALVLRLEGKADEAATLIGAAPAADIPPVGGSTVQSDTWKDLAQAG